MSRKCLLDCSANGAKWADDVQTASTMSSTKDHVEKTMIHRLLLTLLIVFAPPAR